jgi:hypothetical protein
LSRPSTMTLTHSPCRPKRQRSCKASPSTKRRQACADRSSGLSGWPWRAR